MRDYFKFRWAVLSTLMLSLALFGAQAAAAQTGTVQRDVGLTVYDMAWSPDGEWLALALEDGIGIYSPGLEEIARIPISSVVIDVSWSPDSTRLASVNIEDLPLKIWHWDAAAGTLALERAMARGDLDASPDGRGSVVVPEGENQVYVYEHPFLDGAEWSPDGNWLALMISRPVSRSNNFSSAVEIWDTHTWTPRNTLPDEHLFSAGVIAWSPDNRRIALIGNACINDEFIYCDMTYFYIDDTVSGELLYENNGIF
jgi:WD40 repeat protein